MDLVVDTSVILAVIANEPLKQVLVARTRGTDLLAPPSLRWEVGNALSAMLKRRQLSLAEAVGALDAFGEIPLRYSDIGLEASVTTSEELDIYAYDAYFIVCARKHGCALITLDGGLQDAARRAGIETVEVPV